jgi:hypothetical protein
MWQFGEEHTLESVTTKDDPTITINIKHIIKNSVQQND